MEVFLSVSETDEKRDKNCCRIESDCIQKMWI